ncbi:MAG: hypothetical protein IH849_05450 [Acidobacteria bacterium]|nr:hypothetical protein [Acidobacteriota bacterium]
MKQLPDRRALFLIAATGLAAVALAQAQEPAVRIVSPENGGVVEGRNVELKMEVQGVELTPRRSSNAAYVQLRLDDLPPLKGYSETFTFQEVAPGNHVVRVELRRGDGSEFRPPRRTQVRFTVRAMER